MEIWELVARERVRDTMAAYTHAGDGGRAEDLAATFTEDGVLALSTSEDRVGREAIVELLKGVAERGSRPAGGRPGILRHFVTNLRFEEVTPERIRTSSYYLVMNAQGPDHWGRYRDTLVPVGDRWLFKRRSVSLDGAAPGSTMVD